MKKSSFNDAVIAITYHCNSRCIMCNIWEKKDNFHSFPLDDFKKLPQDLKSINLSGGEPFLRTDIVDVVRVVKETCPKSNIIISSNGFATDLIIDRVKEILKIDSSIGIAISVDGLSKVHDQVRRVDNGFEKLMKTIQELKEIGVQNLKIAFTIGDYNYEELRKVYKLSKELHVEFTLSLVHGAENFFNTDNKIEKKNEIIEELDWLERQELKSWKPKKWLRAYYTHGMKYFIKNGKRILPDYSGKKNVFIDPYGKIFPCDVSSEVIGNISSPELGKSKSVDCENSWMICTARESMRKHFIKVILWIIKEKSYENTRNK